MQHRLDSPVLIPRRLLARCEPAGVAISPFIGDIAGNTQAVYAFDPMKLGRHWEATGGLRWERPVRSPAIWTTYNIRKLTVGGGPRFAGKRYRNNANTRFVGNYWTMDAMVMYPVSSKLDLRLNLYNLNNAYYSGTPHRVRTDLSATLFFSQPDEYEGGELTVEDTYGVHTVKLPAGHMVLYPASSLHHVRPVTRGARTLLFDLDMAIQQMPDHPSAVPLTGVYHNLLRRWADA